MSGTVVVTGASRGIGLEHARCFAERDFQVLACCRHPEASAALLQLRQQFPGQLRMVPLDVGGAEAPVDTVESVRAQQAVFDRLTPAHSGWFLDRFGATVPW